MPRRIVNDSDDEDEKDAPVTKQRKPAPVAGKQKLSASALGKRPAVPAKQANAKGQPKSKSKQLSDKELGIRGAKEVMELSDDDDFDPDDDEEDDDDDDDAGGDEETESEDEEDSDDGDDSDDDDDDPRRSTKRQKAPKGVVEAPAASARATAKVSYKEPGLDDADILDDDEHSEDEEEVLKFADDDDMPLSKKALQAASSSQPKATSAPPTKNAYAIGQQVEAKHQAQRVGSFAAKWFGGVVRKVHADGACDIDYDDGDDEERVPLKFIRPPRQPKATAKAEAPTREPPPPKRGPGRPPAPKPPPQQPPADAAPPRKVLPEGANVIELSDDDDTPAKPAKPSKVGKKSKGMAAAKGKSKAAASVSRVGASDDDAEEVVEEEEDKDSDDDTCWSCFGVGELLCCDGPGCNAQHHLGCVQLEAIPEDEWLCPRCVKGGRGGQRKKIRRVKGEAEVNDETRAALAAERERQRQVGGADRTCTAHAHAHARAHARAHAHALGRWEAPTAAATITTRRRARTSPTRRAQCSTWPRPRSRPTTRCACSRASQRASSRISSVAQRGQTPDLAVPKCAS